MPMPKRARDVPPSSPSSSSSDDEGTRRVRTKQASKRRELAALLADQHKHSTSQEMHELQSYVRTVLDGGGDGLSHSRSMHRAARVAALPDMFGVVHDGRNNAKGPSTGTGLRRVEGGVVGSRRHDDDAEASACAVLDAAFHRTRWRLIRFPDVDPTTFHWVKSTPLDASDRRMQDLEIPVDDDAQGDEGDDDGAAGDGDDGGEPAVRAVALRRFHARRALEDLHSESEYEGYLKAQRGLMDHRADTVQLIDAREYAALVEYLGGVVERLASRGTAAVVFRDMLEEIARHVAFLGYGHAADMLQYFGDTRTLVVACDRWEAYVAANLAQYDGPSLSTRNVSECIVVMVHGIVAMRSEALARVLTTMQEDRSASSCNSAGTADVRSALLRLIRMHPFGLLRCAASQSGSTIVATHHSARKDGAGQKLEQMEESDQNDRNTSLASQHDDGWVVLLSLLLQERDRRSRRCAFLEAQSSANVPLQRQEAKLSEFSLALSALASKLESADIELSVEYLDEELELQLEQSRRLEEAVHSGVMLHEQLASEPCSFLMESALWTLPSSMASLQHREIEEALEKYLWSHPYALMNDELGTLAYVNQIRRQLLVNMTLRRAMTRKGTLLLAMRKLEAELQAAVEAESEDGVPLPKA